MSATNEGGQVIHHHGFKHPAKGFDFSQVLRGIIKPGIYSGGEVTFVGNQVKIAPFRAFFQVGVNNYAHITTSQTISKDVVAPNDILYMTYTYLEVEENWIDFDFRESINAPTPNEIILCKINFSGSDIESVDNSYKTNGLFDSEFNMTLEGTLTLESIPLTQTQVGNVEFNDGRYMLKDVQERTLDDFRQRLQQTEEKLIHFALENSYLMQRQSTNPNQLTETYFSEANTSDENSAFPKPCIIMDDDQNISNNWKYREGGNPDYKNGFIKPNKKFHYMEEGDIFDLRDVGHIYKGGMSHYDPINECYWFVTSTNYHSTDPINQYSMLHKLSPELKDGKVTVLGSWYLGNLYAINTNLDNSFYSGCDVMTFVDENEEQFLFLTITNSTGSHNGAGLVKLRINDDGTLGKNYKQMGDTLYWEETWTPSGDFHVCDQLIRNNNYHYWDIVVWDTQHVALLRHHHDGTGVYLMFKEIGDNGLGSFLTNNPRSEVSLWWKFMDYGSYDIRPAMAKKNNKLFLKANNNTSDNRYILEIDVSEEEYDPEIGITANVESYTGDLVGSLRYTGAPGIDPYINAISGYFQTSQWKDKLQPLPNTVLEALAISREGDLLEQCVTYDTTYYPATLHIRKLEGTKYAENQVCKMHFLTNMNNNNQGFEFDPDDDNYIWYSTNNNVSNGVRLYKKDLRDGSEQYITFNGGGLLYLQDLCFAEYSGTMYCYLVGYTTVRIGHVLTKADLDSALGSTIDITSTGASFIGFSNDGKYGICSDNNYLYITNDTTNYIEKWTLGDDVASQPIVNNATYINLGDSFHGWNAITWYNNLFYVVSSNVTNTYFGTIWVFKDTPDQNGIAFMKHLYRENKDYTNNSTYGIAINDNILYTRPINGSKLFGSKTLIDTEVIQCHIHLNNRNVLYVNHIGWQSEIIETSYKPEEFVEYLPVDENGILDLSGSEDHWEYIPSKENYPGEKYMIVGYDTPYDGNIYTGITILNLDEFLQTAQDGEPRYDVEKIIPTHFKGSEANGSFDNCNLIVGDGLCYSNIKVDKEMIYISRGGAVGPNLTIIDLQKGTSQIFGDYYNMGGKFYSGRLKEANLGKGYTTGQHRSDLVITGDAHLVGPYDNLSVRTFMKEDTSDYEELNPVTFCTVGTSSGGNLLRIDWDNNGYRTVTNLVTNIWGGADHGEVSNWIAPSGEVFCGHWASLGGLYQGKKKVWEIQNGGDLQYNDNLRAINHGHCNGNIINISNNSPCYKLPTGEWRHKLIVSKQEDSHPGIAIYDIESSKVEIVDLSDVGYDQCTNIVNFEDKIWTSLSYSWVDETHGIMELEKVSFSPFSHYRGDEGYINYRNFNQWRIKNYTRGLSEPFYALVADFEVYGGNQSHNYYDFYRAKLSYSHNHGMLAIGSSVSITGGIQIHIKGNYDNFCTHESITQDTENPTQYYYVQSKISK